MRTTLCMLAALLLTSAGAWGGESSIDPSELLGAVVDDAAASLQGDWVASSHTPPYVARGYQHDNNAGKGEKSARFTTRIEVAGEYQVRLYYSRGDNRASNVPVVIRLGGEEHKLTVNQRELPNHHGACQILGTYQAEPGDVIVDISNAGTDGYVIVDAVQVVSVEAARDEKFPKFRQSKPAVAAQHAPKTATQRRIAPRDAAQFKTTTSAEIDVLVANVLGKRQLQPIGDEQFLRRAMLDLAGRPPKPEQLAAFAADPSPDKRAAVIEKLLASEDFGRNWANYFSDAIAYRVPPPELTFLDYGPFKHWLADKLNANTPWDIIVREMLTATGKVKDNPAATYVGFHQANAIRLTSETARLFLGQNIQCAQCHDHPFESWKQEEYHHMAGFFARVEAKLPWRDSAEILVQSKPKGEHHMPPKQPGTQGEMMLPVFLTGKAIAPDQADAARREALAQFVTAPENPWFAKALVNRLWGRLIGVGFCEPVDNLGENQEVLLPEVLEAVANHFSATHCDIKSVFRLVMNTQLYQQQLPGGEGAKPFETAVPVRLRSDEIFDSLAQAIGLPNKTPPPVPHNDAFRFPPPPKSTRDLVTEAFGYDPSLAAADRPRTMPQAMLLMNNKQVLAQINADPASGTVLAKLLAAESDDDAVIKTLFLSTLARQPSEKEMQIAREHVKSIGQRGQAFEDLLWSLINTAEFTTRR